MTREVKSNASTLDEVVRLYRKLASAGSISDEHAWSMFDTVSTIVRKPGHDVLTPDSEIGP